ncbi:MAG: hypothetical protein R3190_13340, partial [Thermoanaerobaculia bacterium]|nr:hypothetical protein [Thermoanaerobaculia bacterium]
TESADGAQHFWLEFENPLPTGVSMVFQFLIPSWPYPPGSVRGAVTKIPGAPAMRVPASAAANVGRDNLSEPVLAACDEEETTSESVTVPAGTFAATRSSPRGFGKDVWLSADVPFGLVKTAEANGMGMRLVEYGTDAESAITETPQKLPGAG